MPSRWTNQPISLFGYPVFLNGDDSYGACAVGRPIGRFKVDSHEFHCKGLAKNPLFHSAYSAAASWRSFFPRSELLHHQERTRGGIRNACTHDRSRCCFRAVAAASPRRSRIPHVLHRETPSSWGFPATSPSTCTAQRSNAARRSGSSSLLL